MLTNYTYTSILAITMNQGWAIVSIAVIIILAGILGWLLATRKKEESTQYVLIKEYEEYRKLISKEQTEQNSQLDSINESFKSLSLNLDKEVKINIEQNESLSSFETSLSAVSGSASGESVDLSGLETRIGQLTEENSKLWAAIKELKNASTSVSAATAVTAAPVSGANAKEQAALDAVAAKKHLINFDSIGSATESDKDDLKLIKGIGPFIEKKLNALGIWTFKQISAFTSEDVQSVTKAIEFFPGRIERDNWVSQAGDLAK